MAKEDFKLRSRYDLRFYDSDKNLCRVLDLYCTFFQAEKCFYALSFAFVGSRFSMLRLVLVGNDCFSDSVILESFNKELYNG